jgi:phosphate transport system substrate-binding protein
MMFTETRSEIKAMLFNARACATSLALLVPLAAAAAASAASFYVDPALPAYAPINAKPAAGARYVTPDGAIRIGGAEHARFAVERANALYAKTHPGSKLVDASAGAETAIPNLTYNRILVGSMGRPIKILESAGFKSAFGSEPIEIKVAHAANDTTQQLATSLAVYVHRDNPITQLTTKQVAQILTIGNDGGDFSRWGQLGLKGDWTRRLIHPLGTPQYSGFGTWMMANRLDGKPYSAGYEEYASTGELLKRLENEPGGITVVASGRETDKVKQVAVSEAPEGPFIKGTPEEVQADKYPYGRYLYFYARREADGKIDPVAADYLRLLLSKEGQEIFAAQTNGYIPLNAADAATERAKLDQ